ncbi:MAG: peptidoglycan recognition family protein [Isosphaeraceae bacterium]
MRWNRRELLSGLGLTLAAAATGRAQNPTAKPESKPGPRVGERLERRGDEIVVCGQFFHTTTPVVLWTDPGGYDAYRVERRFAPLDQSAWEASKKAVPALTSPNRYGMRRRGLSPEQIEATRGGGWDLDTLRAAVDQFVIHFDARGTSRGCFDVLHDRRGLSVHFMLDLDGTIYQTLDLKERAWHATIANDRSVGIEVANVGAYPVDQAGPLSKWYGPGPDGHTRLILPDGPDKTSQRDRSAVLRPARDEPVVGTVQGSKLRQYDFTPQQYAALTKLTATLCTVFPKIRCDYPRDASGKLIPHKLPDAEYARYQGVLGHYHVQTNKVDPGPAFQWDALIDGARGLMGESAGR